MAQIRIYDLSKQVLYLASYEIAGLFYTWLIPNLYCSLASEERIAIFIQIGQVILFCTMLITVFIYIYYIIYTCMLTNKVSIPLCNAASWMRVQNSICLWQVIFALYYAHNLALLRIDNCILLANFQFRSATWHRLVSWYQIFFCWAK